MPFPKSLIPALLLPVAMESALAEFNPAPYVWPASFGTGFQYSGEFHEADLDHDGLTDVVVYYRGRGLYWCRRLGATDLSQAPLAAPQLLTTQVLKSLRVKDLDGDGYPDLLAAVAKHPESDQLVWMRNLCGEGGSVSFDAQPRVIRADFSYDIDVVYAADIDADGDEDAITSHNFGSAEFFLHVNRLKEASADFAPPVLLFNQGRYAGYETIAFRDFDGDGDMDLATLQVRSGARETIVWMENKIIDVSGFTLSLYPNLPDSGALPASAEVPTLALARIEGELWFRFLRPGQAEVTFRASEFPASQAAALASLTASLEPLWGSPPAGFAATLLVKRASAICRYKTGPLQLAVHELFNGYIDTNRQYNPEQFLCADLDGDGDEDLFTGYYDPTVGRMTGWFENRLNEAGHADLAPFRQFELEDYAGDAALADLDGNGIADISYRTRDEGMRVLHDTPGVRGTGPLWTEAVRTKGIERYAGTGGGTGRMQPIDLDGDGDKDLVSDVVDSGTPTLLISENLGSAGTGRSRFQREETPLVTGLYPFDTFYLRARDADGDGDPDLSIRAGESYRNKFAAAPEFGFVKDAALADFPVPPVADAGLVAAFNTWNAARPWLRTGYIFDRQTADLDGDGDLDLVIMHGVRYSDASVSWFENRSSGPTVDFRGPLGITGNVPLDTKLALADFDSDGDPDVLALIYKVVDSAQERRVVAFENDMAATHWLRGLVEDREGYFRNALGNPKLSATLQCSSDLNWATPESIAIPVSHLKNPAAMMNHMQWLDPARPRRFYRMVYSLPEEGP